MYSGERSRLIEALGKKLARSNVYPIVVLKIWTIQEAPFHSAPMPRPMNTVLASAPPRSPAMSTSAQAVPSGYGSTPCSFTIRARRSGTIIRTPRSPPAIASTVIWT